MKKLRLVLILLIVFGCQEHHKTVNSFKKKLDIKALITNLEDSKNKDVIVVAHRGDWRNAPENSMQAIKNCIDMGVDMVEIDVRETKDGELVLMHDLTINRTTNAKGFVKDWTLDSLKTLKLIDGLGIETEHRIPTLEEALLLSKNKILINLDKSYKIFDKCYEIMAKTQTLDQVIIKGSKTRQEVEDEFGQYLDKVYFMPVLFLPSDDNEDVVDDYIENLKPVAFEFVIESDTINFLNNFKAIRESGSSVWVNALWPHHNGGHDDEKAALNINVYDWYLENDIDIIQTDRPELLLKYLRSKKLHD